ncbi:hypothetical protein NQD34_013846 [Periophthalmus magnuspinnatus]|nr:hypothetical protein NQD34_013846 [Periophthalmus magnuspinnatus]
MKFLSVNDLVRLPSRLIRCVVRQMPRCSTLLHKYTVHVWKWDFIWTPGKQKRVRGEAIGTALPQVVLEVKAAMKNRPKRVPLGFTEGFAVPCMALLFILV